MYAQHKRKKEEEKKMFDQKRKIQRFIKVATSWRLLK
jgi:hypothetical protein